MEATIFDIDGTLIDSFDTDAELYTSAIRHVFGNVNIRSSWSEYKHVTDEGILREILNDNGVRPDRAYIEATKQHFVLLLRSHILTHGPLHEIPGALDYVLRLLASDEHFIAYATGSWRESALVKLESAGFPTAGICLATSSDFEDRVSIMKSALSSAPPSISNITYFGDGSWDEAAARELGWHFMPVGMGIGGQLNYYENIAQHAPPVGRGEAPRR